MAEANNASQRIVEGVVIALASSLITWGGQFLPGIGGWLAGPITMPLWGLLCSMIGVAFFTFAVVYRSPQSQAISSPTRSRWEPTGLERDIVGLLRYVDGEWMHSANIRHALSRAGEMQPRTDMELALKTLTERGWLYASDEHTYRLADVGIAYAQAQAMKVGSDAAIRVLVNGPEEY